MNRAPRASLTIDLLADEDFCALVRSRTGVEAFGLFVMILLVGRDRFQRGQADRIPNTESLRFEEAPGHVASLARISEKQITKCLEALADVSKTTGRKPWMYLDKGGRLVIRSFFKFNTKDNWGGSRPGAGRKSSDNQDDYAEPVNEQPVEPPENNQLDSNLKASCCATTTPTITFTSTPVFTTTPTGHRGGVAANRNGPNEKTLRLPDDGDMLPIEPGPHEHTPAAFEALYQRVWRAFGSQEICHGLYRRQRQFAIPAWEGAFGEIKQGGRRFSKISYVEPAAARYNNDGTLKQSRTADRGEPNEFTEGKAKARRSRAAADKLFPPEESPANG